MANIPGLAIIKFSPFFKFLVIVRKRIHLFSVEILTQFINNKDDIIN